MVLLLPIDLLLAGLAGHQLMAVPHHLGAKRWVSAHLDGDMSPLLIPDRKGVVIDEWPSRLSMGPVAFGLDSAELAPGPLLSQTSAGALATRIKKSPGLKFNFTPC